MTWPPFPPRFAPDDCPASAIQESDTRYGRLLHLRRDRYLGHALATYGEYSEAEVDLWRELFAAITPRVLVDAGANIGIHTVALAHLAPQAVIVAVEPLHRLYYMLCANVVRTGCSRVYALQAALGAEAGTIPVPSLRYAEADNYGGVSLAEAETAPWRTHALHVPQLRLDDLLPRVDFVKADVEGMELAVLQGATRLLQTQPVLYLEANPGPTRGPLLRYLIEHDYAVWWHTPPHHREPNWRGVPVAPADAQIVSLNLLAVPPRWRHLTSDWPPPVTDPDADPLRAA